MGLGLRIHGLMNARTLRECTTAPAAATTSTVDDDDGEH